MKVQVKTSNISPLVKMSLSFCPALLLPKLLGKPEEFPEHHVKMLICQVWRPFQSMQKCWASDGWVIFIGILLKDKPGNIQIISEQISLKSSVY